MREIRTLRAMRRGLETAHGSDIEALPTETGSNKLGRAYGAMAPVLDPTKWRCQPGKGYVPEPSGFGTHDQGGRNSFICAIDGASRPKGFWRRAAHGSMRPQPDELLVVHPLLPIV